jgi:hypothetical protein
VVEAVDLVDDRLDLERSTEISSTCLIGEGLPWAGWPAARAGPVTVPAIIAATPPATAAARRIGLVRMRFLPGVLLTGLLRQE